MKRRPLVLVFLSLTTGIIVGAISGVKTTPLWSIVGVAISLVFITITELGKVRGSTGLVILGVTLLGLALYGTKYFEPGNLYSRLNTMETVTGRVTSYPTRTPTGTELTLVPTDYRGKIKIYLREDVPYELNYGDRVTIKGEFEAPAVFDDFNYRDFLRKRGVWGVVYQGKIIESTSSFGSPVLEFGWTLRKLISKRIDKVLPDQGYFLKALLFGTRDILQDRTEKNFTKTGLAHLLAASGLHLGIILGASWWVATRLGLGRETTYLLSLPMVFCYLTIVGFKLPLLRASLIYLFGGAHLWLKKAGVILYDWYDRYQALAGAALVLVIINPETLFTAGFQLSFGATFALALFFNPIREALPVKPSYLRGIVAASLSAQLGISPVLAVHFGSIHPWAPLVNILAIPGVTVILYLGIATLIFGPGIVTISSLGQLTSNAILLFRAGIEKISALPLARTHLPCPTPLSLLAYFVLLYWLKRKLNPARRKDLKLEGKLEAKY